MTSLKKFSSICVKSNSYEVLFEHLAENVAKASPFDEQLIVIPSLATQVDVQRRLAQKLGICMNVKFGFLKDAVYQLAQKLTGLTLHEKKYDVLLGLYRAFIEGKDFFQKEEFKNLAQYVQRHMEEGDDSILHLANELFSLFSKYGLYALNFSEFYEQKATSWQQEIFKTLSYQDSYVLNPRLFLQQPLKPLEKPLSLHLFSLFDFPSALLELLNHFKKELRLSLYFLSPTPLFWGDLKSFRETKSLHKLLSHKNAQTAQLQELKAYDLKNHPLLSNWGTQGRRGFEALDLVLFDHEVEDFTLNKELIKEPFYLETLGSLEGRFTAQKPTLLDRVKMDMMTLCLPEKQVLDFKDDSIQVFSAPSLQREVEHLKEQIFSILEQDPEVSLDQIAIFIVGIEKYLANLEFAFSSDKVPFLVALHDRPFTWKNPVIKGFFDLLELRTNQWDKSTWIRLIHNSKFILSKKWSHQDKEKLLKWISKIGVIHGREEKSNFSWDSFFESCLKLAMTEQSEKMLDPLLKDFDLSDVDLLSEFYELFEDVKRDLKVFQESKATFEAWGLYLIHFVESYFLEDSLQVHLLTQQINAVSKGVEKYKSEEVTFDTFWFFLQKDLATFHPEAYSQKVGVLSFYSFFSKPCLKANYTFVLGLDEESFPRNPQESTLHQWEAFKVLGGRAKVIEEDRYLFLLALLNTQKKLFLSFCDKNLNHGRILNPCPLIEELMDYCKKFYPFKDEALKVEKVPLLSFDASYFQKNEPTSQPYFLAKAAYLTSKKPARSPLYQQFKSQDFFSLNIQDFESKINLLSFLPFFKNPMWTFFQKHHSISSREDIWENDQKPFSMSAFEKTLFRKSLLSEDSFVEHYPFSTQGLFDVLTKRSFQEEKEKVKSFFLLEGLSVEDFYSVELRLDQTHPLKFNEDHFLLKSFSFPLSLMRKIEFEGIMQQVSRYGLLSFSKPHFQTLWAYLPCVLLMAFVHEREGLPFEPCLYFPLHGKKMRFDLSDKEACFKSLCEYYQFGLQKPSLLMPRWIPFFMDLEGKELKAKIESDLSSEHFYQSELKDLFFEPSTLEDSLLGPWKHFSQNLLEKPYMCIQKLSV